ncbi:hypothetical protein CK203_025594 [Vitis vinifera]|uniref:Uncharacterized protein n=1 Tax=Vitis vinifera TaxID=29760 RepID=A0A438IEP8_VITVI|nr:hypothetical protein CK203_025594 [Vitis vinifera]
MDRAKLAIKASVKQWEKYWEVIDRRSPTNEECRERDVDSRRKGKASRTISSSSSSDDDDDNGAVGGVVSFVGAIRSWWH